MLSLILTAEMEGVTSLQPTDTPENPYYYTFRVQCTSCHETHPNWVSFNRFETHEIPGSRGEANFVWKCRLCTRIHGFTGHLPSKTDQADKLKKTHSASITAGPHSYEAQEKKTGQKIIEMDCRGLEFIEFKPDGEWQVKGAESGTAFTEVDLSDGEWYDYDDKAGEEVSIKEIKWSVGRV